MSLLTPEEQQAYAYYKKVLPRQPLLAIIDRLLKAQEELAFILNNAEARQVITAPEDTLI